METVVYALIALLIWELFLQRFSHWLLRQTSYLYKKYGKEILYRAFQNLDLTGRGRPPTFSEYVESFSLMSFGRSLNGERILVPISIKTQGQKRVFKRVCRVEVLPTGYESAKYTINIVTLDSNGVDEKTTSLDISCEEKKQFAIKMYYIFVLYHKKWVK